VDNLATRDLTMFHQWEQLQLIGKPLAGEKCGSLEFWNSARWSVNKITVAFLWPLFCVYLC